MTSQGEHHGRPLDARQMPAPASTAATTPTIMDIMQDSPRSVPVLIIGGGLAGCECALVLAGLGLPVTLAEMKPHRLSPAHHDTRLAELVCSNSLRADTPDMAVGLLKEELRSLGSPLMAAADATRVPAGKALAVDRTLFSEHITSRVEAEPFITLVRQEICSLADPLPASVLAAGGRVILATGPLTSESLSAELASLTGAEHLFFYDAIAPIVAMDSVDMDVAWWASRYNPEEKDYCNCPLTEAQYDAFLEALTTARVVPSRDFEKERHFEGCLPIEAMASRGRLTLAHGPMKPVGLPNPRTGAEAFAVVQLRPETLDKSSCNLVGFQTKLAYPEQERVFRLIPGLERAEFLRLGSMHRNTFVNAPMVLDEEFRLKGNAQVHLAGQISGVEGYVESMAHGHLTALRLAAALQGLPCPAAPVESMLGALATHLATAAKDFQPSNVHFGLTPPLGRKAPKARRKLLYAERARMAFAGWRQTLEERGLVRACPTP